MFVFVEKDCDFLNHLNTSFVCFGNLYVVYVITISELFSLLETFIDILETFWPLSRILLNKILEDRISDCFVAQLVWERLGYQPEKNSAALWIAGPNTPTDWKIVFPKQPEIISQRKASVYLTRSIPKKYKQALKEKMNFKGYRIEELFPRRTRRATAVNWLLAFAQSQDEHLPELGPLPKLLLPPIAPARGHPGDPEIE